jgi:hypothetical protein
MQVFLVSAYTAHESCNVVACFSLEQDAKAFAKKCRDADKNKPECPKLDGPDDKWDKYYKVYDRWEKRHPAKSQHSADDYPVEGIKVRAPVTKKTPSLRLLSTLVD